MAFRAGPARGSWRAALFIGCVHCSWCAAPKPTPEDDPMDRDAAPHAEEARSRCHDQSKMALPVAAAEAKAAMFELGRVSVTPTRVMIGARRGSRAGVIDTDGLTVQFTEVADAYGDLPPPLSIQTPGGERTVTVGYEGLPSRGIARHLTLRDLATPASPIAELPPDPVDDSLAYDAAMLGAGQIIIAWDAPADDGSAVFASIVRGGAVGEAVRLSPQGVDADTPRLAAIGPTLVVMWIAHRALPKTDAAVGLEGAGQDLDRTWVELLAFDGTLHPIAPLRHLTPDTGRIVAFDAVVEAPPNITLFARDALELQAGQGGTVLRVGIHGPEIDAPAVFAEHVGRGTPLYIPPSTLMFVDPADRGRMVAHDTSSPEPVLDGARPLAVLTSGDILVAPEGGMELHVVRCP
jgi:hypothetical protein